MRVVYICQDCDGLTTSRSDAMLHESATGHRWVREILHKRQRNGSRGLERQWSTDWAVDDLV